MLSFLAKKNFYLAGGTALALQLGHRTSLDFDFYNQSHFDANEILTLLKEVFPEKIEEISFAKDTLFVRIDKIPSSFFWYKYPLISNLKEIKGLPLASLEDIAAMKLIALIGRAKKRDYIDIFYLLKILDLEKMFSVARKKYPLFNPYIIQRALTFFNDIVSEEGRITVFDKNFSWAKAKKKIMNEVRRYQLSLIKK